MSLRAGGARRLPETFRSYLAATTIFPTGTCLTDRPLFASARANHHNAQAVEHKKPPTALKISQRAATPRPLASKTGNLSRSRFLIILIAVM